MTPKQKISRLFHYTKRVFSTRGDIPSGFLDGFTDEMSDWRMAHSFPGSMPSRSRHEFDENDRVILDHRKQLHPSDGRQAGERLGHRTAKVLAFFAPV